MKMLVLGRGKTGALVAEIARDRGHEVRSFASQGKPGWARPDLDLLKQVDVVIDFTTPHAVIANIIRCAEAGIPIVVGTTGWQQHMDRVRELINERKAALLTTVQTFPLG